MGCCLVLEILDIYYQICFFKIPECKKRVKFQNQLDHRTAVGIKVVKHQKFPESPEVTV